MNLTMIENTKENVKSELENKESNTEKVIKKDVRKKYNVLKILYYVLVIIILLFVVSLIFYPESIQWLGLRSYDKNELVKLDPYIKQEQNEDVSDDLLEKFKPLFYYHKNELFYAVDIRALIKDREIEGLPDSLTSENIFKQMNLAHDKDTNPLGFRNEINDILHYGMNWDHKLKIEKYITGDTPHNGKSNAKVIAFRNDRKLYYFVVYGYNGTSGLGDSVKAITKKRPYAHPFDTEVCVIFLKSDEDVIEDIYLSEHDTGYKYSKDVFQYEGPRPIIYISKGTHAHYNDSGVIPRILYVGNDHTAKNIKWDPDLIESPFTQIEPEDKDNIHAHLEIDKNKLNKDTAILGIPIKYGEYINPIYDVNKVNRLKTSSQQPKIFKHYYQIVLYNMNKNRFIVSVIVFFIFSTLMLFYVLNKKKNRTKIVPIVSNSL